MNEYNYRYVTESILPRTNPQVLIDAFVQRYEDPKWKLLLDSKLNALSQVQILEFLTKIPVYSGLRFNQQRAIWNAYCFAHWGEYWFKNAVIDDYGFIKYKDIGYEPRVLEEWQIDQVEPQYTDNCTDKL
jgi:hypothetical protein